MQKSASSPTCFVFLLATSFLLLASCSPYALRGRVIEGHRASVQVVLPDDPRLSALEQGVADAEVVVTLDPGKLNSKRIGTGVSTRDGSFAIPVDVVGAGTLLHEVEVSAGREDFVDAAGQFVLPGKGKRVLVTLPAGERKVRDDRTLLEQTMEEAERYLE